jgi:chromobox protein 5
MESWDVDHIFSTPYHHHGNGQVERFNYEVMRHLRDIIFDRELYSDWSRFLPHVKHILNTSPSIATGLSPLSMLFGSALPLHRGLKAYKYPAAVETQRDNWFQQKIQTIEDRLRGGRERQAASEDKALLNQPVQIDQFHVDEWVWLSYPNQPPTKLHPRRSGPYKIIAKKNRSYEIENILTGTKSTVDIERLSRVTLDDTSIENIKKLLSKDLQQYIVEAVREYRLKDGQHQFLIKWKDYPEAQNTWEPYENLKDNIVVKDHIKSHKIKVKYRE